MRILVPIIFVPLLIHSAMAEPAKFGAIIEYNGKCLKIDGDKESTCAGRMMNMRFLDGFDSFQFNEKNQTFESGITTAFVGSQWRTNKSGGDASRLADSMTFMPLEQVVVSDKATNKMQNNKYRGQCVLEFKTNDAKDFKSLKKVWCEYTDGKTGHVLSLTDIDSSKEVMMRDFGKYQ